jgi:hypothetical protein
MGSIGLPNSLSGRYYVTMADSVWWASASFALPVI